MEGTGHFTFRRTPKPGRCPVAHCRRCSRPNPAAKNPSPHRLCSTHRSVLWRKLNPWRAAYNSLKSHAKQRDKVFDVTFAQFSQVVGMQAYVDGRGKEKHMLTLDRIESWRGYVPDNIQVLTCGENAAKENRERRDEYVRAKKAEWEKNPF